MKIYRELAPFLILESGSVRDALLRIEQNKRKIVFVVDEKNTLVGCFADGDYRRWSIEQESVNLSTPVIDVCRRSCIHISIDSSAKEIEARLEGMKAPIPLVDEAMHVVALAETGSQFISFEDRRVSEEDPVFVIAEVGNNHQGDLQLARKLVDAAVNAEVDCVKFQMRTMSALYGHTVNSASPEQDLGSQYTLALLEKYQLSDENMYRIFDYCVARGVTVLCTPWDCESLEKLERYGMGGYKIASADLTNTNLLHAAAETGKPLICSTGMSSEDEIRQAAAFLENQKAQYIFLHCNSTYPTPYKDVNLHYLERLREITRGVVGYSGHERGYAVPLAAVSLGAKVIEKHLTVDRRLEGNDHSVSLLPDEFAEMVRNIRSLEEALGSPRARELSQGELVNREVLAKSLFAAKPINAGDIIQARDVEIRSPGIGIQPNRLEELVGKHAPRNIAANDVFFESDIKGGLQKRSCYRFQRPYGIPVRYHDYAALTENVALDFVEFHLTYRDLEVNSADFIVGEQPFGLAVHAPEIFAGDHLLDLASQDRKYRARSIAELQRVIEHVAGLRQYFPVTDCPVMVLNAGGWNPQGFEDAVCRQEKYELVEQALEEVDSTGVKLAIQTMPPFPWHFGGQSFHNLFVRAEEIVSYCERTGAHICLDISHSMMACNYYDDDLCEFIEKVSPHVIHMHVVDAKGVDGEGVQIGHGDVDFRRVSRLLEESLPNIPFIPEVWQGHNDGGAGFWEALDFLERRFSTL